MKKSFTLLELLIVVLIIGILVIVALPTYTKIMKRSRGAEIVANLGTLARAIKLYYVETGHYPDGGTPDIFYTQGGVATWRLLNTAGLSVELDETNPNRKWDYGCADLANFNYDHDPTTYLYTDYMVFAHPHDIDINTGDIEEMKLFWHGHMEEGEIVGEIINKNPKHTGSPEDPHDWNDHQ